MTFHGEKKLEYLIITTFVDWSLFTRGRGIESVTITGARNKILDVQNNYVKPACWTGLVSLLWFSGQHSQSVRSGRRSTEDVAAEIGTQYSHQTHPCAKPWLQSDSSRRGGESKLTPCRGLLVAGQLFSYAEEDFLRWHGTMSSWAKILQFHLPAPAGTSYYPEHKPAAQLHIDFSMWYSGIKLLDWYDSDQQSDEQMQLAARLRTLLTNQAGFFFITWQKYSCILEWLFLFLFSIINIPCRVSSMLVTIEMCNSSTALCILHDQLGFRSSTFHM